MSGAIPLLIYSAEIKNEWIYTSTSFIRFDGVNKDLFNFSLIVIACLIITVIY